MEKKIGKVENKIPEISVLATTAILNINIREIENQIPDTSELGTTVLLNILVKLRMKFLMLVFSQKTDYNAKTSDIEETCFATSDYNYITSEILDAKEEEK